MLLPHLVPHSPSRSPPPREQVQVTSRRRRTASREKTRELTWSTLWRSQSQTKRPHTTIQACSLTPSETKARIKKQTWKKCCSLNHSQFFQRAIANNRLMLHRVSSWSSCRSANGTNLRKTLNSRTTFRFNRQIKSSSWKRPLGSQNQIPLRDKTSSVPRFRRAMSLEKVLTTTRSFFHSVSEANGLTPFIHSA